VQLAGFVGSVGGIGVCVTPVSDFIGDWVQRSVLDHEEYPNVLKKVFIITHAPKAIRNPIAA
jgi:hypothetical protein